MVYDVDVVVITWLKVVAGFSIIANINNIFKDQRQALYSNQVWATMSELQFLIQCAKKVTIQ